MPRFEIRGRFNTTTSGGDTHTFFYRWRDLQAKNEKTAVRMVRRAARKLCPLSSFKVTRVTQTGVI